MKRTITETSLSLTLKLVTDTEQESERACSPFGIRNLDGIITQGTLGVPLMVLLNSLVKQVENLQSKSCTDSDISNTGTPTLRALPCTTQIDGAGIN